MRLFLCGILFSFSAFAYQSSADHRHFSTGYLHGGEDKAEHVQIIPMADLPRKFDWRTVITMMAIKNQKDCGACYAFGTTAALEAAILIAGKGNDLLSEQEIVSCSQYYGCGGGNFAHGYQQDPGQSLASEFPYKAADLRCKSGLSHKWKIKRWAYVGQSGRAPSVEEIKTAILQKGVVPVTITAGQHFMDYESGVFDYDSQGETNHIVALVGWDDDEGVWILRNSWGTKWGEQGYMRIKYGVSRVGEEATFVEL